jgi:NAD(P)-dependent dehydrogenase (short-subunit alcohol dehydrogenase family)
MTRPTVLITGASSGVGAGCAVAFATAGWDVAINFHGNAQGAERTAAAVRAAGGRALVVRADVGDEAQVSAMISAVRSGFGRLDALINNAGITRKQPFADTPVDAFDRLFATNLRSAFLVSQACLPLFAPSAAIVNISSTHALHSTSLFSAYGATKGGLEALTRGLAIELGPRGIRANALRLGIINVERDAILPDDPLHAPTAARIPLRRMGVVEDVAHAALFLAAPTSAYITGQVLAVDGGWAGPLNTPYAGGFSDT